MREHGRVSNMRTNERGVPLAMLEVAARALDEAHPDELTPAALAAEITGLWTAICRLQAQLTRRVAAWHRRGGSRPGGALSTPPRLRHPPPPRHPGARPPPTPAPRPRGP